MFARKILLIAFISVLILPRISESESSEESESITNIWTSIVADNVLETKLTASDGVSLDIFGRSVDISDGKIIVGSRGDGTVPGKAYLYELIEAGSYQETILNAPFGIEPNDGFGWPVAIDGDTIVVGAHRDNDSGIQSGSAFIYEPNGLGGFSVDHLLASDGSAVSFFGLAVAVKGDTAYIGSPANGVSGSVYIFVKNAAGDFLETEKLTAGSDGHRSDAFGQAVSVSTDIIAVGAPNDDAGFIDSRRGAVYIFKSDLAGGRSREKLTAFDGAVNDRFGWSVAVEGNTVVVGAPQSTNFSRGAAYVFTPNAAGGYNSSKLIPSSGSNGDKFGASVSIADGNIIVGSPRGTVSGHPAGGTGAVYLFEPDGSGGYMEHQFTASDAAGNDNFGDTLAIDGETLVVGSFGDDDNGFESGSAYAFVPDPVGNQPPVANAGGDRLVSLGSSVLLNGSGVDPDGDPLTYAWMIVSKPTESSAALFNPTTRTPSLIVDASGEYIIQLIVNDGEFNSEPDSVILTTGAHSISGSLTTATGEPIDSRAVIQICAHSVSGGSPTCFFPDGSGAYSILNLGDGDYFVEFESQSPLLYASEWYDNVSSMSDATVVTVDGLDVSGIDAELKSLTTSISGSIISSAGEPIIGGVQVCAHPVSGGSPTCFFPDGRLGPGTYSILNLGDGDYFVEFESQSPLYASEWYDNVNSMTEATVVSLRGDDVNGIDAELRSLTGTISGTVINSSGARVEDDEVIICAHPVGGGSGGGCSNSDSGEYRITELLPGSYSVEFMSTGTLYASEWYDDKTSMAEATIVSVAAELNVTGIDAVLKRLNGLSISGTVMSSSGDPITGVANVQICAHPVSGSSPTCFFPDGSGAYSILNLGDGDYFVEFESSDFRYASEWYDNVNSMAEATVVTIDGANVSGINAILIFTIVGSISEALNAVSSLVLIQVTTPGHRTALSSLLNEALVAISSGDTAEVINKLQQASRRTNGCSLRGSPDLRGFEKDWITDCVAQIAIYNLIQQALIKLTPP